MLIDKLKIAPSWLEPLGLGKAKNVPMLGLDISSTAIKLVELSRAGKNCQVERYVIEALPKDAISDGNLVEIEGIAETLRRAWKRLGDPPATSLSPSRPRWRFTKLLVPVSQTDNLSELIEAEANQSIPFPLEEVNLDHQVLGPAPASIDDLEVLPCAARKEKWRSAWRWWKWPACAPR